MLYVISYQLSVISYQLSVISYQLSVISYQLSVISYQLSVIVIVMVILICENYIQQLNQMLISCTLCRMCNSVIQGRYCDASGISNIAVFQRRKQKYNIVSQTPCSVRKKNCMYNAPNYNFVPLATLVNLVGYY